MYFLIDFENVKSTGMRGTEYLLSTDFMFVFYSENALLMEQRHLLNIQNSGCGFETYKLLVKRKNGLDFYIATKVGELLGANCCNQAVLISNDNGFKSIREFCQECSGTKNQVYIGNCIEHGIIVSSSVFIWMFLLTTPRCTVMEKNICNFFATKFEKMIDRLRFMC